MKPDSAEEIVALAQRYLNDKHPDGATITVIPDGILRRESWWYVDVKPDHEPARTFEYYEALAEAETALEEQEDITVFFQPIPVEEIHLGNGA